MGESGARRAHLTAWSALHHGIEPAAVPLLRPWLRAVAALAVPLRRVPPLVVTCAGAALAIGAVGVAAAGLFAIALILVLASVLCDALDGAIAVLADRASAVGAVADKSADRIADTAFALVVWQAGAPLWLAACAGASTLLLEAIRESLRGGRRARITVAERPTRVVCAALACVSAAVAAATWPATVCAAVWLALGIAGVTQLCRDQPRSTR